MIKIEAGGYTFTFNDGTSEKAQKEAIKTYLERGNYFRNIIIFFYQFNCI